MEDLGFYQESPRLRPHKWSKSLRDGWVDISIFPESTIDDVFNECYNWAFKNGIEQGKKDKAKEICDVLNINQNE